MENKKLMSPNEYIQQRIGISDSSYLLLSRDHLFEEFDNYVTMAETNLVLAKKM